MRKMKCDGCYFNRGCTLESNECGAGFFLEYCAKGHWDGYGCGHGSEEEKLQNARPDPWIGCKDFKEGT